MKKNMTPDLKLIARGQGAIIPAELDVKWVEDAKGRPALQATPTKAEFVVSDEWVIALTGIEFTNGVIEFDALGQSEPPQSNFLGISFRYVDERTHDAVYFRPFNFRSMDAYRKAHAVQYISHPEHHWFDLRRDQDGQYEKPVLPAPDGDAWFHARIVIQARRVSVYVDDSSEACLVVDEFTARSGGGIGLWVGPGQGGYFANLTIVTEMDDSRG